MKNFLFVISLTVSLFLTGSSTVYSQVNTDAKRIAKQYNKQLETIFNDFVQTNDSLMMYNLVVEAVKVGLLCDSFDTKPDQRGTVKPQYRDKNKTVLKVMRKLMVDAGLYLYRHNQKLKALEVFELYLSSVDKPLFALTPYEKDNYIPDAVYYTALIAYQLGDMDKANKYLDTLIDNNDYARRAAELKLLCMKKEMTTHEDSLKYCKVLTAMYGHDKDNDQYFAMLLEYYSHPSRNPQYVDFLKSEIKAPKQRIETFILYGDECMKQRQWDDAIASYSEVMSRDSVRFAVPVNYNLGICYNAKAIEAKDSLTDNRGNINRKGKEIVRELFRKSVVYLEKVRILDPERKKVDWAKPLYQAYYALSKKKKAEELKPLIDK